MGGSGRPGHRGGAPGRQRVLAARELRLALLGHLAQEPRHGYDLIRLVGQQTGGVYLPSAGVVYPALSALEDAGLIAAVDPSGGRKAFAITEAGAAEVTANRAEIDALDTLLRGMGRASVAENAPVRRAMDNLKVALGTALAQTRPDTAFAIAAIIDEATQKIERLA